MRYSADDFMSNRNGSFINALGSNMPQTFPEIQRGGSLILAWQIKNKNVLVVGGGEVSHHDANTCVRKY